MTISNSSRTAGPFIGNGVTKTFPFSYKVFSREDVLVAVTVTATKVETILTLDADYSVALNSNQNSNPGGVITLTNALPAGSTLAATSNIALVQSLDLTNQGGFYPKVINDALDRIVINIQQLAGKIGNGLGIGLAATTDAALTALAIVQQIGGNGGAALVGFLMPGAGTVSRTVQDKLQDRVSVFDFMTKAQIADVRAGTVSLDLTAAIQAAVDFAYTNNIGTVYFPSGGFAWTTIVRNWDAVRSLNIVGAGKRATRFSKFGASTTPLFQWTANDNILETYSNFEGFSILGNAKTHHGIQGVRCARFTVRDVDIRGCDRAIDNVGSLVWYGQGLTLQGNNFGVFTDRAPMPSSPGNFIYPNAITLRDSNICFNTAYGVHALYGNGMRIRDCDIEANGTAGDQNTGGVIFKSLNTEFGVGSLSIDGTWFEANKGWAVTVDDACTTTAVTISDCPVIGSEAGRAIRVMSARSCNLRGVMALSPGDTAIITSSHSHIEDSTISVVDDRSLVQVWTNVTTATTNVQNGGGFSNGLTVNNGTALKLTWSNGAGVASLTPDTNNGALDYKTPSGLHRINNHIGFQSTIAQANVKGNNTLFVDAADGILKFRNVNGTVYALY